MNRRLRDHYVSRCDCNVEEGAMHTRDCAIWPHPRRLSRFASEKQIEAFQRNRPWRRWALLFNALVWINRPLFLP